MAQVRQRPDPVVVHGLVRVEHERVSLPRVDLDRVDRMRERVDSVRLNDRHRVAVDAEHEVHVTRGRYEPEAVTPAVGDGDDGQAGGQSRGRTAFAVDERRVCT